MYLGAEFAGKFIVLDGPDGCGKSTQARLLAEWVQSKGVKAASFRDPGTTRIGEEIRHILLNPANVAMSTATEVLLYMAARVQLWEEKIGPELAEGKCVILDRWLSSTCAYQGYAGGFGVERAVEMAGMCLAKPWPDVTVILDVDEKAAAGRMKATPDRMEQKGAEYHAAVRRGFLSLADDKRHIFVVDASGDIESVHKAVVGKVEATVGKR